MNDPQERLESLGRELDRADTELRALHRRREHGDQLDRILARADASSSPRIALRAGLALAGVSITALLLFALWPAKSESGPWFTVGPSATRGSIGAQIRASGPTPIVFSDGTRIDLAPLAQAKVASMNGQESVLVLQSGSLRTHVAAVKNHAWVFSAGPFRVFVHGTTFRLAWDPAQEIFDLELEEGAVGVRGPLLAAELPVGRGQSLHIAIPAGSVDLLVTANPAAAAPAPNEPPVTTNVSDGREQGSEARSFKRAGGPPAARSIGCAAWQDLARRPGHAREAIVAAECAGVPRLVTTLPVNELLQLGDVARAAGDAPLARQILISIRRRFPGADESAVSAYLMGRTELELGHRPEAAAPWFTIYLDERPAGDLAASALGRLIESLSASGQIPEARRRAEEYVERFPRGAHRDIANRMLGR